MSICKRKTKTVFVIFYDNIFNLNYLLSLQKKTFVRTNLAKSLITQDLSTPLYTQVKTVREWRNVAAIFEIRLEPTSTNKNQVVSH